MNKVSKANSYAIKWLSYTGLNSSEISKELKISEEQIMKILEKESPAHNDDKVKTGSGPVKQPKKNLMINQTAGKKAKTVSIMTEAASQNNDQELQKSPTNKRYNKDIFRPHNA